MTDNNGTIETGPVLSPMKPYIVEAAYDWILDNGCRPHIGVATYFEGVQVPDGYADEDDIIILNLDPNAVHGFMFNETNITFSARFNGQSFNIVVPYESIYMIYPIEIGKASMIWPIPDKETYIQMMEPDLLTPEKHSIPPRPPRGKPNLKIVK